MKGVGCTSEGRNEPLVKIWNNVLRRVVHLTHWKLAMLLQSTKLILFFRSHHSIGHYVGRDHAFGSAVCT